MIMSFVRKKACLVNSCFHLDAKNSTLSAHPGYIKELNSIVQADTVARMFDNAGGNTGNSIIGYSIFKALASAGIQVIAN